MKRLPKVYNKFKNDHCAVCLVHENQVQLCVDHVKTFGSGGKDIPENCMTLCKACHTEKGIMGISGMATKYVQYRNWLISNNWYQRDIDQKWVNDAN